jgi:hypothetical protein
MNSLKNQIYILAVVAGIILAFLVLDGRSDTANQGNPVSRSTRGTSASSDLSTERDANLSSNIPVNTIEGGVNQMDRLDVSIPSDWIEETPSSALRIAQYRLPALGDDNEDGSLVIFNRIGGTIQQNLDRWYGQFTSPDGSENRGDLDGKIDMINGMRVTFASVIGVYETGSMGLPQDSGEKSNYMMLAAIVETPEGPYFFKALGPENTLIQRTEEFEQFIQSISYSN